MNLSIPIFVLSVFGLILIGYIMTDKNLEEQDRYMLVCFLSILDMLIIVILSFAGAFVFSNQDKTKIKTILNKDYVICLNPTEIKVDNETFTYCKGKENE